MEIKIASTRQELDKVFELRYQVYVEEEKKFGGVLLPDKKIYDEFDSKADTINLIMLEHGEAISTVRFTGNITEQEKLPSDKLYDFDSVRKDHAGIIPGNIGMLAIRKSHRNTRTFTMLMLSLGKQLLKQKYGYYMFTLNHECSNLFCRIMGAKKLNEKIWSPEICNYIIPMILYKDQVQSYVKKFEPKKIQSLLLPVNCS